MSALSPETILEDVSEIYGINRYILTIENPIELVYNGYGIETNYKLVWDPPKLSAWDKFQKWLNGALEWYNGLHWGWKIGIGGAFIAAGIATTILSGGAFLPALLATAKIAGTSIAINAGIGAIIGGITGGVKGALNGALSGAIEGFMWGGILLESL